MVRFIRTWCNAGMPGTKPFFEAYVLLTIELVTS